MIAAAVAAWWRRDLVLVVGGWLVVTNAVVWVLKQVIGRTPPGAGVDVLAGAGQSSPSGHAALGASCLLVIAVLMAGTAGRYVSGAVHVLAVGVATATVALGYKPGPRLASCAEA